MLAVQRADGRQFGGVGAMIAVPGLQLTVRSAARLQTSGPLSNRALRIARMLDPAGDGPRCHIEISRAPREHVGLGTGTQLSMAIVAGLNAMEGGPPLDAPALACRVARGERSAIGLHGFVSGGLLFERGKAEGEAVSPLVAREDLPEAWRFVLLCPKSHVGLHGDAEQSAFASLPPVPETRRTMLERLAGEQLLPAAARADFSAFSAALYEFGYLAGLNFAAAQGGPFAGRQLTSLVALVRRMGIEGVGQSSWGPTVFALCRDEAAASDFAAQLARSAEAAGLEITIAPPDNRGARIEVEEGP
jgi:beta-RFAP synthase